MDPAADRGRVATQVEAWLAAGPIDGLYALAALDIEPPVAELDIDQWRDGLQRRVKRLAPPPASLYERLGEARIVPRRARPATAAPTATTSAAPRVRWPAP